MEGMLAIVIGFSCYNQRLFLYPARYPEAIKKITKT
jgi:hypothetical protein